MTSSPRGTRAPLPTADRWPPLPLSPWQDTFRTLHLWTQVVGKVRMVETPWINHSWSVALYVSPRGLTTGTVHHRSGRSFQVDFDFVEHLLYVTTSDGERRGMELQARSVADFHGELMALLADLGVGVEIVGKPNEVEVAIPFAEDTEHASYDPDAANRFWRVLLASDRAFQRFRSRFLGKCSPVHFFWGAFDLAVSRFSGRPAPEHPGGLPNFPDPVAKEAYSHEVSSAGFWPGIPGGPVAEPAYYSYVYPAPDGFDAAPVRPEAAYWSADLGEWVLPYEAVRTAQDPEATLMEFLQSTYEAAADLAGWDREALEREEGRPG